MLLKAYLQSHYPKGARRILCNCHGVTVNHNDRKVRASHLVFEESLAEEAYLGVHTS